MDGNTCYSNGDAAARLFLPVICNFPKKKKKLTSLILVLYFMARRPLNEHQKFHLTEMHMQMCALHYVNPRKFPSERDNSFVKWTKVGINIQKFSEYRRHIIFPSSPALLGILKPTGVGVNPSNIKVSFFFLAKRRPEIARKFNWQLKLF